jgi:uncharacterized protein (DUF2141 family)
MKHLGLALVAMLVATISAVPQSGGSLEGVVVDAVTGQLIVGASVTIAEGISGPPDSDARARATVSVPAPRSTTGGGIITTMRGGATPDERFVITEITTAAGEKTTTAERVTSAGERTAVNVADIPRPAGRFIRSVTTDQVGGFAFTDLRPGAYALGILADGYLYQVYAQTPQGGGLPPINVVAGANNRLVVRLIPGLTLSGAVINPERQPAASTLVYLSRQYFSSQGERQFRVVMETLTDREGNYTFSNVEPGRYFLATGGLPSRPSGVRRPSPYAWTYYPGVSESGLATAIDLQAGTERRLHTLELTKTQTSRVGGRVLDARTGKPPRSLRVRISGVYAFMRSGQSFSGEDTYVADYDPLTGRFEFTDVPKGTYRVDAILEKEKVPQSDAEAFIDYFTALTNPSAPDAFEMVEVSSADVQNLQLTILGTGRVRGKVVLASGRPLSDLQVPASQGLRFLLSAALPLQPAVPQARVRMEEGTFEVTGAFGGRYLANVDSLPDNFYVSEIRLNGARVTGVLDLPKDGVNDLTILLSPGGAVEGTVVDAMNRPVPLVQGLLLPDPLPDGIIGRLDDIYADAEGRFRLQAVAPGRYKLYVWRGLGPGELFERALWRRSQAHAMSIQVEQGTIISPTVKVIEP